YNAVASCRYARPKSAEHYEPAGVRGDGPSSSSRYWGLSQQDYYAKADVWPLNPNGELLVVIMCESVRALGNLDDILTRGPGIGGSLIGARDLSQELGVPGEYDHPHVKQAMDHVLAICRKHNVPVGHPHVTSSNVERVVAEGYRFILSSPVRSYAAIQKAKD